MSDKKSSEPTPEDWKKADTGFQSIIDGLEHAGFDLSNKECDCTGYEAYGEEDQRRGISMIVFRLLDVQIGHIVEFTDCQETNGKAHKESILGVVTGVFFDGFAFVRLREKGS